MKLFTVLLSFLIFFVQSTYADEVESENQLWIMIKADNYFRSASHLQIVDQLSSLVESSGLGELDGHSSGAHQFEFNYYEVENYIKAKSVVERFISKNYPSLIYTVSNQYETHYEKL